MSQGLFTDDDETPIYDLVGVGFGPSNLSLAIALAEHNGDASDDEVVTAHFLERQPQFSWHRGMLIEDTTMQVSFLKDLVTLRNPASRFSFLSYLQSKGRLVDFINHKTLFPLRIEFHDYLEWCAAQVDDTVSYGHDVAGIRPVVADGEVTHFDVVANAADGGEVVLRARNLAIATGLTPRIPSETAAGGRVWHSSELLHRIDSYDDTEARRFVVIGAGQSAAECTAFLHERFPAAEVCSVFSRFGYSPSDDSPFANRVFDPGAVDDFFGAPEQVKETLLEYHANTNYSVVDLELIEELYRRTYREKVQGVERLRWFNAARAVEVAEADDAVKVTVESMTTGERTLLDADAVVYATGYRAEVPLSLLGDIASECHRDDAGNVRVERDYRIATNTSIQAGIYLQGGGTEQTHGITASLLSNNAIRAGEILDSLLRRQSASEGVPALPLRDSLVSSARPA